ncbi:MAG: OB-fold domain-containing protein [Candidatus Peregrinibacteria bacterium]|nr:OB-fold domain-containing protein [Candidatus Peregrinibacteria bacterium]
MTATPPIIARAQAKRRESLQDGTIESFTLLAHPLKEFGSQPRTIGMILLDSGKRVLAPLLVDAPMIGMHVHPRMRLSYATKEGLRVYEVAYEASALKPVAKEEERVFPGYILALTGPSGVGKSTVSRLLATMSAEYTEPVPILTTRSPKQGDEGEYVYVSKNEFDALRKQSKIVAMTEIPSHSEERFYGYRKDDIEAIWNKGKLPVVITEMHLLQGLASHFGRRSILSFGLLPPGRSKRTMLSHLLHRLRTRGRDTEEHIRDRMKNAERDLAFFKERSDLFDHIVVNEDLDSLMAILTKNVPGLSNG